MLGGEKLEAVVAEFVERSSDRRKTWREAIGTRLAQVRERAKGLQDRLTANLRDYQADMLPQLNQKGEAIAAEIAEAGRSLPSHLKGGAFDEAIRTNLDAMISKVKASALPADRLEQLDALRAIAKRMPQEPASAFTDLQQMEKKLLGSLRLAAALSAEAQRIAREDRRTQWGRVRGVVADAIRNKELNLSAQQLEGWDRIWQRWTKEEQATARGQVFESPAVSRAHTAFDASFTRLLKQDGELAAIWGFAAKSFISAAAKEEFYQRQIMEFDTIEKVKRGREFNLVTQETILKPAMERFRAADLSDALRKWKAGALDDLIDLKRIQHVIRERGMIPAFGLEHYLVSSKTGTLADAEKIHDLKSFNRAVIEYCKPGGAS